VQICICFLLCLLCSRIKSNNVQKASAGNAELTPVTDIEQSRDSTRHQPQYLTEVRVEDWSTLKVLEGGRNKENKFPWTLNRGCCRITYCDNHISRGRHQPQMNHIAFHQSRMAGSKNLKSIRGIPVVTLEVHKVLNTFRICLASIHVLLFNY
jgi:hypothetical protein